MGDTNAKRYYKKLNTTFTGVNKQDEFAKVFMNILKSGNTSLYQKERRERRVFDDAWMTSVEAAIPVLDKVTRNPRENLKVVQQVVPVERAKKIDKDTIRHLASNTQFIKQVDAAGNVTPSKVLTSYYESDLGTYENRFLKTLVDKLFIFIEKRYDLMVKKMHTEYVNYFTVKSELNWENANIDYDITLKINQTLPEDEIDRKNQDLFDRMTTLRTSITNFKMSNFMNQMKEFNPISPPIMKTNVIMKNPDFRTCYDLWLLMDSIDQIGFDIEVFERDIDFDPTYLDQVYNALMVLYATIGNSQKEEFIMNQDNPFEFRQERRPKVAKTFAADIHMEPGQFEMQNNNLNQYYLDQIKKSNYSRFKTLKEAGISVQESIDIVFKQINNITNAVYEDYIQTTYDPQSGKTLEENIKIREDILAVYRLIEEIKRNDIREVSTNKAIALLELRNLQDQKKVQIEAERQEQARIKAELKEQAEQEQKAKEKAKLNKLKQIERAKKVLENAEKARQEKAIRDKEKARLKAIEKKEKEKQAALEAKAKKRQKELDAKKAAKAREQELRDQAKRELDEKLREHRLMEKQLKDQVKAELKARLAQEKAEQKAKTSTK
ncbi:MAG: hypothetical protein WC479_05365 [Candidatus Izemoplasmatales bacterium]|jgi:hypothetical protein|nr:hypothetical protein [Candidatus Izemoplasmatales bacterium]MDD3865244.1 hypothetical protein [Candidatus Izemoplasmatales bacterium]